MPHPHFGQIPWNVATRAPEVNLEGERVLARAVIRHPSQRRVRDETAISVRHAIDLYRRQAGRQRTAITCSTPSERFWVVVVEVNRIAVAYVDRADTQAHLFAAIAMEIAR